MTITLPIYGGPPKGDLIRDAYQDAGLSADYEADATEMQTGLRRLNAIAAELLDEGCDIGFNFPINGLGAINEESGIAGADVTAITTMLALRLSPTLGKTMSPEATKAFARSAASMRSRHAVIPSMRYPRTTPLGQGSRRGLWWGPFASGVTLGEE